MKKKLLFVLTSMNIGGVEKSFLSLLSTLDKDKEKYDVTVLLLEKRGGFLGHLPNWVKVREAEWFEQVKPLIMQPPQDTIKQYYQKRQKLKIPTFIFNYLFSKHFNNRFAFYSFVFNNVPNLQETYDVAVAYQGPTDIIDYFVANKVSAKYKISWVHFDVSKHQINYELYKRLYRKFDNIFVVSNLAGKKLVDFMPSVTNKVKVRKNIISPELVKAMAKEPVDLDPDFQGIKIVTVGRLSKEKGQDIAIRTLHRLREDGYNVRWYCIGDGKERKNYEELINKYHLNDEFLLFGAKTNPYPYMQNADIYVQTSRHESYCLTLAEAKILNKPIVTTGFLGAFEQLTDGVDGYIAMNEEDLFLKIKQLIKKFKATLKHKMKTEVH